MVKKTQTVEPPKPVKISFWLLLAGGIITLIGVVPLAIQAVIWLFEGQSAVQGISVGQFAALTLLGVIEPLVQIALSFLLKSGKNLIRILVGIVAAVGIISVFSTPHLFGLIGMAVTILGVALLWIETSNEFFRGTKDASGVSFKK